MEIENANKVLYPETGYTKGDIARYYKRVAKLLLPHLKGRPISMQRAPDGIDQDVFFHKEAPEYFPDWVDRVTVPVKETGDTQPQVVISNTRTLLYLVDQGMITPHPWLSTGKDLEKPDRLIFDIDPPKGKSFDVVKQAARDIADKLRVHDLHPYLLATGGSGLHVVAPLQPSHTFDTVREFARQTAQDLAEEHPENYTTALNKQKRKGRIFLDYLRNAYGQTSVPPYAVRTKENAPVAVPLKWDELTKLESAHAYTIKNLFRRLGQTKDPWHDFYQNATALPV